MPHPDEGKDTQSGVDRSGPLDGLLIADFSHVLDNLYCTMLPGDLDATVVKIKIPECDGWFHTLSPSP